MYVYDMIIVGDISSLEKIFDSRAVAFWNNQRYEQCICEREHRYMHVRSNSNCRR